MLEPDDTPQPLEAKISKRKVRRAADEIDPAEIIRDAREKLNFAPVGDLLSYLTLDAALFTNPEVESQPWGNALQDAYRKLRAATARLSSWGLSLSGTEGAPTEQIAAIDAAYQGRPLIFLIEAVEDALANTGVQFAGEQWHADLASIADDLYDAFTAMEAVTKTAAVQLTAQRKTGAWFMTQLDPASGGFGEWDWTESVPLSEGEYDDLLVSFKEEGWAKTDEISGRIHDQRGDIWTDGQGHYMMVWEE